MAACEICWERAQQDAFLLDGSVVDHYHRRIEKAEGMPYHAPPPRDEEEGRVLYEDALRSLDKEEQV